MARPLRVYVPGMSFHVIQRGNNRSPIFGADIDYEVFLRILQAQTNRHAVSVHAYALMKNHYHLIVTPADRRALPLAMKAIGVQYVQYFNRKYQRVGTLWCSRYRALIIADERYWLTCLRYVEQNPTRARIVNDPGAYRWSSYGVHGLGRGAEWLEQHRVYLSLGRNPEERQTAYRALCTTPITEEDLASQRLGDIGVRPGSDPGPTPSLPADPAPPQESASAAAPCRQTTRERPSSSPGTARSSH
jgi:putative transposase